MLFVEALEVPDVTFILQGNFLEALPIAQRAAAICHATFGPIHPHTQQTAALVQLLESTVTI